MRTITTLLLSTAIASAQSGPPPGFFGNAPNVGGTLYLTFCTPLGWPCRDFKQDVWGQICYGDFAQRRSTGDGGRAPLPSWPFTRYIGWKCPGYVPSEEGRRYCNSEETRGACYSDHGTAVER